MGFKRNFTSDFFLSEKNEFFKNEFFKIKFKSDFFLKENNGILEKYIRSDFCLWKTMSFWKNISDLIFV